MVYIRHILLLVTVGVAFSGGYKIPEQSVRSTGTAGAYFSSALAPDAAYYNPANMAFLEGGPGIDLGVRYIVLPKVDFRGEVLNPVTMTFVPSTGDSLREEFLIPYFHYVSPRIGRVRVGLSFVTPAGLAKRWNETAPRFYAEEFRLEVYELDLSVAYLVSPKFAVGGGVRGVYARGKVKYEVPTALRNSLSGDTDVLPGFYLSLSFRPTNNLTLSTLYRSKVDLRLKGSAAGYLGGYSFSTGGNVKVPLPAEWRLGISYTFGRTTLDLTYERTFWSAYERLDFNFNDPVVETNLGRPQEKDWDDTNTYRVGVFHRIRDDLTLMGGVAYDETPIPGRSVGFELPDSDGWILSLGGIYTPSPKVEIGLAYLLFLKKDRSVSNDRVRGEFSDISAHMLNLSLGYRF